MNSIIRRTQGNPRPAVLEREMEPLRTLRNLFHWEPFQEFASLLPGERGMLSFLPPVEIKETKETYLFCLDVPGVKLTDIEVNVTGNRLTVTGKREEAKEEKTDTYYACERNYGTFSRSFTLPEGTETENVHADLSAGVLTIVVPKKPDVQPKKIVVKPAPSQAIKS